MKRILFITVSAPGNHGGGGEVYTEELLRELASFCVIDLVYFRYESNAAYQANSGNINILLEQIIDTKYKIMGFLAKPLIFPYFSARYSRRVSSFLTECIQRVHYDAVYFDHSQTFSYATDLVHPCKILMCHDVVAQKYMRSRSKMSRWVKSSEKKLLSLGTAIFTLSKKDCDLIQQLYGHASTATSLYISDNVLNTHPTKTGDYFVMFGAWGRPENYNTLQWMINEVVPILTGEFKILVVGGGKMPNSLRVQISLTPGFEYIGFLDNPYPLIANSVAEIVPLKLGAGVKVKCVEALACGTPIIGTDVAFEGIPVFNGMEPLINMFNNAEELVSLMRNIKVDIDTRLKAKKVFCSKYNQRTVVDYIRNL